MVAHDRDTIIVYPTEWMVSTHRLDVDDVPVPRNAIRLQGSETLIREPAHPGGAACSISPDESVSAVGVQQTVSLGRSVSTTTNAPPGVPSTLDLTTVTAAIESRRETEGWCWEASLRPADVD
eukprot:2868993-Amphidinium_carterae.1